MLITCPNENVNVVQSSGLLANKIIFIKHRSITNCFTIQNRLKVKEKSTRRLFDAFIKSPQTKTKYSRWISKYCA